MRMRLSVMIAAGLALLASACATPTVYGPALNARSDGYSEQQVEPNRFLVKVRGNYLTSRNRVEQMLLYRAAELTLNNGFDHFVLTARDTEATRRLVAEPGSSLRYGLGWGWSSSRWSAWGWHDPLWGASADYQEINRYDASAEVAMFKGAKPADNPNAYDARAVKDSLAAVAAPLPSR